MNKLMMGRFVLTRRNLRAAKQILCQKALAKCLFYVEYK